MKSTVKYTSGQSCYICTRRQKVFAWFVLIGIFVCGMMTGVSLWGYKHLNKPEAGKAGLVESVKQAVESKIMPCHVKEEALLQMITENDHLYNVRVYERLGKIGCEKNKEKFANLVKSEQELADAVRYINSDAYVQADVEPCEVIERTLLGRIDNNCYDNAECHSYNAEVYAKMAEDGCAKNKEFNTQKALNEIQIAEGVRVRDGELSESEVKNTVNTYKKLQMQNEARRYIKKAEKLINPGVDFIMELQRVIEE